MHFRKYKGSVKAALHRTVSHLKHSFQHYGDSRICSEFAELATTEDSNYLESLREK